MDLATTAIEEPTERGLGTGPAAGQASPEGGEMPHLDLAQDAAVCGCLLVCDLGSRSVSDLDGDGQGDDEVDKRKGDRRAEVDGVSVQLGADDDQPEGGESKARNKPGGEPYLRVPSTQEQ